MREYVRAFVIDNYNYQIYELDMHMSKQDILDVINFHLIGSQIRFVNKKPYKIICETFLKEGYTYFPTTMTAGYKPDILGSIIIVGIDEYGDSVSLTDEDIQILTSHTSLMSYNKDGILKAIYTLEVENLNNTNTQYADSSLIPHMHRIL